MSAELLILGGLAAYAFLKSKGGGGFGFGDKSVPSVLNPKPAIGSDPYGFWNERPIGPPTLPGSNTSPPLLPPIVPARPPAAPAPPVPPDPDWLPDNAAVVAFVQAYANRADRLGRSLTQAELDALGAEFGYTGGAARKSLILAFLERKWTQYLASRPSPGGPGGTPAPVPPPPAGPADGISEAEAIATVNNYARSIGAIAAGATVPDDILRAIAAELGYTGSGLISRAALMAVLARKAAELGYQPPPPAGPGPLAPPAPPTPTPPPTTRQPYSGGVMSWPDSEVIYAATHPSESSQTEWRQAPQEAARRGLSIGAPGPVSPGPAASDLISEADAIAYVTAYAVQVGAIAPGQAVPADILNRVASEAGYTGGGWISRDALRQAVIRVGNALGYGGGYL